SHGAAGRGGVEEGRGGGQGSLERRAGDDPARAPGGRAADGGRHHGGAQAMTEVGTVALEDLGSWRRSHTCGELTLEKAGAEATLMGWVHRVRDHGGVLFIDLRDRHGIIQVVFRPEIGGADVLGRAGQLGLEWVIAVRGRIAPRPAESLNPELPTGEIELEVKELKVLSSADPLPFQINEELHLANEDLRLRYRYLDLRRPELAQVLELRHRAMQAA